MEVPKLFKEILENNKAVKGVVYSTIETFGEILEENSLYFFEEYTDHGIRHIEAVLNSCLDIINNESVTEFLDYENVSALILSVALHDIGMHHTPKSFKYLVSKNDILIPWIDKHSWAQLWELFIEEVKKFSAQKRMEIFGDYDYIIEIPDLGNFDKLNGYQRKLIGEFLRRHHPRIAHEIAIAGFETGDAIIPFANGYEFDKRDLVGLIARSHGMNIRDTYQYLKRRFYQLNKTPCGIHVYYLMIIVRLADYFQIDRDRLRLASLKLKSFNSPISESEHNKHLAVREIKPSDENIETLFVRAQPDNNFIFWKLKELINEIQKELDTCWAVLGEKYGRDSIKPGLKYRHIVSNLTEESFRDSIDFIPEKIFFNADADLAKLLVAPLYGDNPTYGVRELIQNAIDAINERKLLDKHNPNFEELISVNILHDSEEKYYFEIIDSGKGMSVYELANYFLKAGATNRKSKEWDQFFIGEDGKNKVLKTGKFGVGILAAFLIGDEIEVSTRRYDSSSGLSLRANINSKDIEIKKIKDCQIGTRLKIFIRKEALFFFKVPSSHLIPWDKWYTSKYPVIRYNCVLGYQFGNLGYEEFEPGFDEENDLWINFKSHGYTKLRWSYESVKFKYAGDYQLTCNGLILPSPPPLLAGSIPVPNIQVFDFNGIFPISLNRNNLDSHNLPFETDLINSVFTYILNLILSINPETVFMNGKFQIPERIKPLQLFQGLKAEDFFGGFLYKTNGYIIRNGYLNDFIRNSIVVSVDFERGNNMNYVPLFFDNNYFYETSKVSENIRGNISNNFGGSAIDCALYKDTDPTKYYFHQDSNYKTELFGIRANKFISFRHKFAENSPIQLGKLNDVELGSLKSVILRRNRRFGFGNREFDNYLSKVFTDLDFAIIPYEEKEREKKLKQIMESANNICDNFNP